MSASYTPEFYAGQRDESLHTARTIVPVIMDLVAPRSVADVGCGTGTWTSVFAEHGAEIIGFDGDYVARDTLLIPEDRFRGVDLTQPIPDAERVDLAVSLEVGEHLPEASAGLFVDTLTGLAPVVVFSAAIPWQGGTSHVNEQWQSWWAGHFAQRGYVAVDALHERIWTLDVSPWYPQNMVLYVHEESLANYPKLAGHRVGPPRDVVHPGFYRLQHTNPSGVGVQARELVRKVRSKVKGS